MSATERINTWLPWAVRALWLAILLVGGEAIDGVVADRTAAAAPLIRWAALSGWLLGVAGLTVLSVITLTLARVVIPASVPISIVAWAAGADAVWGAGFTTLALVTTALALSGDFGQPFVQASAYGEERRHLLRPPLAYLTAAVIAWVVAVGGAMIGVGLLASQRWILGTAVTVLTVGLVVWAWPRWHRLSRRWFVVVPIGLVIHDHLVLAETVMLRRQEIGALRLAPAESQAADFTGPCAGSALEIVTTETVTALLAGTRSKPAGTAIHLNACLVAPTRPGQALRSAAARRLPIG